MIELLQLIGIAYLLVMVYLSFLYYKRNNYSLQSFIFWLIVWAFGGLLLMVPQSTSLLTQRLSVARVIDFYLIIGLMFFSVITFFNYAAVKRTETKMEEFVRRAAIQKRK
jgi:hypothetical protein